MLFCFFGAKDARKGNRVVGQWEQRMLPRGGVESTEVLPTLALAMCRPNLRFASQRLTVSMRTTPHASPLKHIPRVNPSRGPRHFRHQRTCHLPMPHDAASPQEAPSGFTLIATSSPHNAPPPDSVTSFASPTAPSSAPSPSPCPGQTHLQLTGKPALYQ